MKSDADLWTRIVSGVLFPLHERLKGHSTTSRLRELEASQWWEHDRLEAERLKRLRAFVADVGGTVPYYRRVFEQTGFQASQLHSLADLARLPFLTKSLIRANLDALKSDAAGPLKRYNTGGSTGEPLVFYMGRERISHDVAAKWRATRWWGVDVGDPEIVVWGSPIELGAQDRVRQLRDWMLRTRLLPAFEMSEANLDRFVAEIRRTRPRMIFGYPSALVHIADHAGRGRQRLDDVGIEVAFVTSERLYDHQRERIAAAFGCRVANGYGGRDAGFVAHECPEGGMHLSAEDVIVEIVDAGGNALPPGRPGEIVVTHLSTRDFPFVRYRTGDIAALDDRACPCGRGLPMLREIQGRSTDFVVAENGTVMHGLALIYILRDLPQIASFKIVQESRQKVRVLVVSDAPIADDVAASILSGFKARLGAGVDVAIDRVEAIPPERSGKFRYVVSQVVP
jgi:phenylacetate-CoA ligase